MTSAQARPRARELGLRFGELTVGEDNAITDVPGVRVGSVSLVGGEGRQAVRTGVTALVPHGGNVYVDKLAAAVHVINGHGKPTGLTQVAELGQIETPIVLTNTLSVGDAFRGLVLHALRGNPALTSVNPLVLECNDGELNDIRALAVRPEHVLEAIENATPGPVAAGAVGAGVGMTSFGWKSGLGTASRLVDLGRERAVVGVLVLANFGYAADLLISGVQVGRALKGASTKRERGSVAAVIATDLALDARQLGRLARRVQSGVARVGGHVGHRSGEFAVALSVARGQSITVEESEETMDVLFHAVIAATEEAIVDSLFLASAVTGIGGRSAPELPVRSVLAMIESGR